MPDRTEEERWVGGWVGGWVGYLELGRVEEEGRDWEGGWSLVID